MTPCYEKSALFDSTELDLHAEAKALCKTCPAMTACRANLAAVQQDHGYDHSVGPRGTWAGMLLAPKQKSSAS